MLDPTRLCCGQKHSGPVCPDGKVMCQLCFGRFEIKDLYRVSAEALPDDVCKPCGERDSVIHLEGPTRYPVHTPTRGRK